MVTFIAALAITILGGLDYQREAEEAAKAAGTTVNSLPASEQARLAGRYPVYWVVSGLFLIVPFGVFALAVRELRGVLPMAGVQHLLRRAVTASVAMFAVWIGYAVLSFGLLADPDNLPPLVRDLGALNTPFATVVSVLGLLAMLCVALAFRRSGVARRLALVMIGFSGLLIVVGTVAIVATSGELGLPPIVPFVPALALGIGLLRAGPVPAA
jgi:hypothetical protein